MRTISFLFIFSFISLFPVSAQNKIVCNFDHIVFDARAWGDVSMTSAKAPAGSLGNAGLVSVPANNAADGIYFDTNIEIDKVDYSDIKFSIKPADFNTINFMIRLENTNTNVATAEKQISLPESSGNEWLEVITSLSELDLGLYNRIVLIPVNKGNAASVSFYIDNLTLVSKDVHENSPVATIRGNKFYAYDKEIFFNGINTAWQENNEWRLDFLGRNYSSQWWKNEFDRYVANKINTARIWIHGGGNSSPNIDGSGMVTGASNKFWNDMDALIKLAKERELYMMPTLWSFDMCKNNYNATKWKQFRDIINDEEKTKSYCENFLVPFVKRYDKEPYVLGYDLCNEPDHIWRDNDCGKLSRDNVIRFFATCAAYVHKNTNKPVTVGSMWIICNSDKYKSWTSQERYAGNNYSDASFRAQYDDPDAYLDFYSPHWYQWQSSGSFFTMKVENWLDNDYRPVLIGETPGYNVHESGWNSTLANMYINAYKNGYSGVCAWKNPKEDDGYGKFASIIPATNAFYEAYPDLVYPNSNNGTAIKSTTQQEKKQSIYLSSEGLLCIQLSDNTKEGLLKLYAMDGQLLFEKNIYGQTTQIDVSSLPENKVYIAQITTDVGTQSEKIVY